MNQRPRITACAACCHQHLRCEPNCILKPYFPNIPTGHLEFENVNNLFSAIRIKRLLESLDDQEKRDEAMRSIIYESNARARDPVGGCSRIICHLQQQTAILNAELHYVRQHIAYHRTLQQMQQQYQLQNVNFNNAQMMQNQIQNLNDNNVQLMQNQLQNVDYNNVQVMQNQVQNVDYNNAQGMQNQIQNVDYNNAQVMQNQMQNNIDDLIINDEHIDLTINDEDIDIINDLLDL